MFYSSRFRIVDKVVTDFEIGLRSSLSELRSFENLAKMEFSSCFPGLNKEFSGYIRGVKNHANISKTLENSTTRLARSCQDLTNMLTTCTNLETIAVGSQDLRTDATEDLTELSE